MGNYVYRVGKKPEYVPDSCSEPTFDPEYGFKAPRKKRVPPLTEQEMIALNIPPKDRDYCAHLYRDGIMCTRDKFPFFFLCYKEMSAYKHCQEQDLFLRIKEFEREKRLRIRKMKAEGKTIE